MNIWQKHNEVSKELTQWAIVSLVLGFFMRFGNNFWKQVGAQFAGWAIVNLGIALVGRISTRNRLNKLENPGDLSIRQNEARKLHIMLLINAGLDVIYMLSGRATMKRDKGDGKMRGMGWGIIAQAAFLFYFDAKHANDIAENPEE